LWGMIRAETHAMLPLLALATDASAVDVLIIYSDPYFSGEVRDKLVGTGRFPVVDLFDAVTVAPSAATLAQYQAILVYSNSGFTETTLLGNRLADYVDGGGGVVEMMFANVGGIAPLNGRFNSANYDPVSGATFTSGVPQTLQPLDASHPVLAGVNDLFNGTMSYNIASASLSATADLIAQWDDGAPAVAVDTTHTGYVVGLNMFPSSDDLLVGGWDATTDGAVLMANALEWVAGSDLDGDGVRDTDDNCVATANPDQADGDGDTVGDACDQCAAVDTDLDGICDDVDQCPGFDDWLDTDGDTAPDGCDICPEDNPDDIDGDGVCTTDDVCFGTPNNDGDGDGNCNSEDVCPGEDDRLDGDDDGDPDGCDCGPTDPDVFTGALETCDGLDNDCDGETDPDDAEGGFTFYLDVDGDGFGDDADTAVGCVPPLNFATAAGDCNDDLPSINPDAVELCDDVDNDCDGKVDQGCPGAEEEDKPAVWSCGCDGSAAPVTGAWALLALGAFVRRRR
jgi:MYXO-CTERM domain-containing protein